MTVTAPATASRRARAAAISLTFSGLAPATRYFGTVAYSGSPNMPAPTMVTVNTP